MANSTRTQKNVRKANLVRLVGRVAFACSLLTGTLAMAAPLNLVQYPPGSGGKEPAPNVIVSIDNSGSMAWNAAGGTTISASNPSRMTSLKAALITQFGDTTTTPPSKGKIEDNRMRLAWQSMWDASDSSSYNASKLDAGALNSMKPFSGTHRSNFTNFVKSLRSDGGTPSHKMLDNAYNYMKTAQGTNSPWADNPGTPQDSSTYKDCRRTYHIFMTDGAWSSGQTTKAGNADGTNTTLPNPFGKTPNRTYSMTSDQTRVYRDTFGGTIGTGTGTLSDLAFRAWAEDLQPNMNNNVRPLLKKDATEAVWVTPPNNSTSTCTTANNCTPLEPFWNPRNNPAEWQHIAQYNIGFGSGAANWNAKPDWVDTGNPKEDNFGGDYAKLVNGLATWGNPLANASFKEPELWHSALNGRGR